VEKAIEEMRDKKAVRYHDAPGDVLQLLGESGLRIVTQLINSIYLIADWLKDVIAITVIIIKKTPKATKCSDHHTVSLIAHTAKIVVRLLGQRIERNVEEVL
jgi:hypothetical protein